MNDAQHPDDEDIEYGATAGQPEDTIPDTGGGTDIPVEEIAFSDLIDLSDPEEMDALAGEFTQNDLDDMVDSDAAQMEHFTHDEDVLDDFRDRQQLTAGSGQLLSELRDNTGQSPDTSGDDVDAAWTQDRQSGEESVGASVATPEQNVVSDLGEAVGLEYNDFEPLSTEDKIDARDQNRWELNAESQDDEEMNEDLDRASRFVEDLRDDEEENLDEA